MKTVWFWILFCASICLILLCNPLESFFTDLSGLRSANVSIVPVHTILLHFGSVLAILSGIVLGKQYEKQCKKCRSKRSGISDYRIPNIRSV